MKIIKRVSNMLMAVAAFIALPGFAATVSTVAELTNAVANASAGDTIVITASLTPTASEFMDQSGMSFLKVTAANLTIMGSDESSRKTWTQNSEPVVINCGGLGRFLQNNGSNLTVKNITVTGSTSTEDGAIAKGSSTTFTNCVFRQNLSACYSFWASNKFHLDDCAYISNAPKLCGYLNGCDIANNTSVAAYIHEMDGCTFSGHDLGGSTMITLGNATEVSDCSFTANIGTAAILYFKTGAQVKDCKFLCNTNNLIRAQLTEDSDPVEISGCTFTSNVIANANNKRYGLYVDWLIWNKTNDFTSAAAAQSRFLLKDSTFEGNCYQGGYGMAEVFGVTATGCTFGAFGPCKYNPTYNVCAMSAYCSRLEDCDISGGDIAGCVLNRCTVHDVTDKAFSVFRDYCRVTNTLVKCCNNNSGGLYTPTSAEPFDAQFVNCTIVSNTMLTISAIWDNNSPIVGCSFINCVFNGNRTSAVDSDITISSQNSGTSAANWTNHVHFSHSYYGKFEAANPLTAARFAAKTNGVDALSLCVDPKFAKDSRTDAPYWSLLSKSPLVGKGDASIWTAEDVDLAGNLRLKDGKVDIGCYQCWLREPGMMIFVR